MSYTSRSVYEYISQQTNDPIIERKTCVISGAEFPIYQSDLDFYDKISPTFAGQKFQIPTPTLCPEERQRRRLSFRNERKLYKRKCDATGENIISIYSPDKPHKVYDQKIWWSDSRDPMDYGFDFDFSKTFGENFALLTSVVPRPNLINDNVSENSQYVNQTTNMNDSYFCFDADYCDSCLYSNIIKYSKNCTECTNMYYCEHCFGSVNCTKSYNLINCNECDNSSNLRDCYSCSNCEYCIGCSNLVGKKYWINNQPSTKEEYEIKASTLAQGTTRPSLIRSTYAVQTEQSIGNNLRGCKNCVMSYNLGFCENVKYSYFLNETKDSMDFNIWGVQCSRIYECETIGENADQILFSQSVYSSIHNILYSQFCHSSSNLFGCIGLRNKQYCIFNKQYTKEAYEEQVAKIITHMISTGEWGEFFHPSLSPFGYNETVAQEYYPLQKVKGINKINDIGGSDSSTTSHFSSFAEFGYYWSDYNSDPVIPAGAVTIERKNYSNEQWLGLRDSDEILKQIIVCEISGRPFRLVRQELEFYRKHNLSLPSKHPDIRHEERMKLRPGRTLYLRECDCCGKEMLSVYESEEDKGIGEKGISNSLNLLNPPLPKVYCEQCYQKEVFG